MSEKIRIQALADHEYAVEVTEGEREPVTSIYDEFPLDTVASRFPDFADELRLRLAS